MLWNLVTQREPDRLSFECRWRTTAICHECGWEAEAAAHPLIRSREIPRSVIRYPFVVRRGIEVRCAAPDSRSMSRFPDRSLPSRHWFPRSEERRVGKEWWCECG